MEKEELRLRLERIEKRLEFIDEILTQQKAILMYAQQGLDKDNILD